MSFLTLSVSDLEFLIRALENYRSNQGLDSDEKHLITVMLKNLRMKRRSYDGRNAI